MDAYLAFIIQIIIGIILIFIYKKYLYKKYSVLVGTLIVILGFFIKDAFPYVYLGWGKIGGTIILFNTHIHHSFIGICLILFYLAYYLFIPIKYKEKRIIFKIDDTANLTLWISLLLVISQLHEIIYFNCLFFPDRSFPIQFSL